VRGEAHRRLTIVVAPVARWPSILLPASPHFQLAAALVAGALLLLSGGFTALHLPVAASVSAYTSLAIGMVYGVAAAYEALRAKAFDIDVLMVVAAALAAFIGHPAEGALLLTLFVLAGSLEDLATEKTNREISSLATLLPADCLVLRPDAVAPSGSPASRPTGAEQGWVLADASTLVTGETIRVRPGERAPTDCKITVGESSFDQSAITGEAIPRPVAPGDELFAGTINTDDAVEATVLRPVRESSIQKILDMVTSARERRQPIQQFIDRFSQPYSLGVLFASIAIFFIWWQLLGVPAFGLSVVTSHAAAGDADGRQSALYTAITFLIVTSPCALIIATPTATLCAIARAARGGVLVKGGDALLRLAATTAMCLDKTGTLTFGRPRLYEVHPVAWSDGQTLLAVAAALELNSTHPIATAIKEAAKERLTPPLSPPLESINHHTAKGLEAQWEGRPVRLGTYHFVEPLIAPCYRARIREILGRIQRRGHIAIVIAAADHASTPDLAPSQCGVLIMSDALRPGAHNLAQQLREMGISPIVMLTGDNILTAQRVAQGLSLDDFHADLLPQDKLTHIQRIKAAAPTRTHVALVGDGMNDAPALAAADVSLAMGAIGTAAALENADVVLLSESLTPIPWAIALARRARRTIFINITFATSVIVLMAAVALVASALHSPLPLWAGVLAHEGGTLLVVLHSLWLLRK